MTLHSRSNPASGVIFRLMAAGLAMLVWSLSWLAVVPSGAVEASGRTANSSPSESTAESQSSNLPDIRVAISAGSAIVLEPNRARMLYGLEPDKTLDATVASKLMTGLIAAEQLKLETMVTISSVAAKVEDQAVKQGQAPLKTGEKYSFEFLLLRMLFYDSDPAAIALAEQVSGEEALFVQLMNTRAQKLELAKTRFVSSSGLPYLSDKSPANADSGVTTTAELGKLAIAASQNKLLANALGKRSEYLVLEGLTVVSMHHQLESLWTLSDSQVTAVAYSRRTTAITVTWGTATNGIPLVTVVAGSQPDRLIDDPIQLYDAVRKNYEIASLVDVGDRFFGGQEQTIDGETFGLVYLNSITYVRPKGRDFLQSTVEYQSFGPFSRPILSGAVVGQAVFKLLDGTRIAVDVGPDRQILSSVSLFDRALKQLQGNPNLTLILLGSLAILILVLLFKLLFALVKLYQTIQLFRLEWRSHR